LANVADLLTCLVKGVLDCFPAGRTFKVDKNVGEARPRIGASLTHLLGVVLFLGNVIVTAVWKTLDDGTREPARSPMPAPGHNQRIGPSLWRAAFSSSLEDMGWSPLPEWIPLHTRGGDKAFSLPCARIARAFAQGGSIPDSYWRLGRRFAIWGTIATLLRLVNLYLLG
jgi:hypothetical protein